MNLCQFFRSVENQRRSSEAGFLFKEAWNWVGASGGAEDMQPHALHALPINAFTFKLLSVCVLLRQWTQLRRNFSLILTMANNNICRHTFICAYAHIHVEHRLSTHAGTYIHKYVEMFLQRGTHSQVLFTRHFADERMCVNGKNITKSQFYSFQ